MVFKKDEISTFEPNAGVLVYTNAIYENIAVQNFILEA